MLAPKGEQGRAELFSESEGHGEHDATSAPAATTQPVIAQKLCPIMGNPIDPKLFVEHEGRKVYFCCPPCMDKFKADPAKYLPKLDEQK